MAWFCVPLIVLLCTWISVITADLPEVTEICRQPPATGRCRAKFPMWFYNHTTSKCEEFIYGGCKGSKNRFGSEEQCYYMCTDACKQPPSTGFCRAKLPHWYYNVTTGSCTEFSYGGCKGSRNRFSTKQECVGTCSDNICSLPPVTGSCRARLRLWYYNPTTRSCQQFTYGGCGGNDNRFTTEEACLNECDKDNICSLPPVTGSCRARLRLWYYNPTTRSCQQFTYGGCGGNDNRFTTEEACLNECGKATTSCKVGDTFELVGRQAVSKGHREKKWFLNKCNPKCNSLCLFDHSWGYCMAYSVSQTWYGCNCYLFSRHVIKEELDADTEGRSQNRNCQ